MERGSIYHRKMRANHIRRKKRITRHYWDTDRFPYYKFDGMYSKNKIHCSCPLCAAKTNNKGCKWKSGSGKNWKHSDLQRLQLLHDQIVDIHADMAKLVASADISE